MLPRRILSKDSLPDGGTTATLVAPSDGRLAETQALVVRFGAGRVPSTLRVGGTLASVPFTPSWSTTATSDDTLTLTPSPLWAAGNGQSLTVAAADARGVEASLAVSLDVFETLLARFTTAPAAFTRESSASFAVSCAPEGCVLSCALDGAAAGPCPSPWQYTGLSEGEHSLRVVASWGATRKEVRHTWRVDRTPPSLVSAGFDAYGELKVVFDEPIDALAATDLSRYGLTPGRPASLGVVGTAVRDEVLRLYLSGYQLPIDYTLTVSASDAAGNTLTGLGVPLAASTTGSRVAFLSKARVTGNILAASPGASTGLQAADALCQSEAQAAGLAGTFRAFLSDGSHDAGCRMLRLGGKLANNCGQASAPVADTGPWLGVDGLPLVRSHSELLSGAWLRPLMLEATGSALLTPINAWHATETSGPDVGRADTEHCLNWSTADSAQVSLSTLVSSTRLPFRLPAFSNCTASLALTCLQVDGGGHELNARYRQQGKWAFITSTSTTGAISHEGLTGMAAADAICQERASAAGMFNSSRFVAWLSTATTDAYCRVLGGSGRREDVPACGLQSVPATGPWVTTTGFRVADTLEALVTSGPRVPVFMTETEGFPALLNTWTGTSNAGESTGAVCADWTATVFGKGGTKSVMPEAMTWSQSTGEPGSCASSAHLLCLER